MCCYICSACSSLSKKTSDCNLYPFKMQQIFKRSKLQKPKSSYLLILIIQAMWSGPENSVEKHNFYPNPNVVQQPDHIRSLSVGQLQFCNTVSSCEIKMQQNLFLNVLYFLVFNLKGLTTAMLDIISIYYIFWLTMFKICVQNMWSEGSIEICIYII